MLDALVGGEAMGMERVELQRQGKRPIQYVSCSD
jgi:hypothetical protein